MAAFIPEKLGRYSLHIFVNQMQQAICGPTAYDLFINLPPFQVLDFHTHWLDINFGIEPWQLGELL